ncbi:MAG: hypothetical protein CL840_00300 [Crocinitomicaceae bacterium]|nr:hypothetical protein [Crocinitomicaceae bacterium]
MIIAAVSSTTSAQVQSVAISYYGQGYIRPGVKAGVNYTFRSWTHACKDSSKIKERSLILQPQIGAYWKHNSYTGAVLNAEGGIVFHSASKKVYSAYTAGIAYMAHFEVMSFTADFSGKIGNKKYELRNYLLPTINLEYGWFPLNNLGLFSKLTMGWRLSPNYDATLLPSAELGIRWRINKPTESE